MITASREPGGNKIIVPRYPSPEWNSSDTKGKKLEVVKAPQPARNPIARQVVARRSTVDRAWPINSSRFSSNTRLDSARALDSDGN